VKQASARHARRGGGWAFLFISVFACSAAVAGAAEVLFPKPLHLTRRIDDPFVRTPIVVDEYCAGNRIITVRGDRVVIADYDRQEITEIDRGAATYSITRFDEIAKTVAPAKPAAKRRNGTSRPLGTFRNDAGRALERYEIAAETTKIELGVDRSVKLPRAALDALVGAAYPYSASEEQQLVIAAAGTALPAEQIITHDFEGQSVVMRNVVTRVAEELVPPELTAIPPGAKRVESRFQQLADTAAALDRP
jgi:hypothetical protein